MNMNIEQLAEKLLDATNKIYQLERQTELLIIRHSHELKWIEEKFNAVEKRFEQVIKCL